MYLIVNKGGGRGAGKRLNRKGKETFAQKGGRGKREWDNLK